MLQEGENEKAGVIASSQAIGVCYGKAELRLAHSQMSTYVSQPSPFLIRGLTVTR